MSPFFDSSANKQESSWRSCLDEIRETFGHTELLGVILWIKEERSSGLEQSSNNKPTFLGGETPTKQNRRDELIPAEHDFYFHV